MSCYYFSEIDANVSTLNKHLSDDVCGFRPVLKTEGSVIQHHSDTIYMPFFKFYIKP